MVDEQNKQNSNEKHQDDGVTHDIVGFAEGDVVTDPEMFFISEVEMDDDFALSMAQINAEAGDDVMRDYDAVEDASLDEGGGASAGHHSGQSAAGEQEHEIEEDVTIGFSERSQIESVELDGLEDHLLFIPPATALNYNVSGQEQDLGSLTSFNSFYDFGDEQDSNLNHYLLMTTPKDVAVDPYTYLYGTAGVDALTGGVGLDKIYGYAGDDVISVSLGADIIYGGLGTDTYSFSAAAVDFTVNLALNTAVSSLYGTDTLNSIENVTGGSGDDVITGDAGDNVIIGGLGDDTLDGGGGNDTLDYSDLAVVVNANLSTNIVTSAASGTDTVSNFEIVRLGSNNDIAVGDTGDNMFYGGDGDDNLSGGDGDDTFYGDAGNDTINGGNNIDTLDYSAMTADINANLGTTITSAEIGTDTASSIEILYLGSGDDEVRGTAADETIYGGDGDDEIWAKQGDDIVYGGDGNDEIVDYYGDDILYGGNGDDLIDGCFGSDTLYGGVGSDTLYGDRGFGNDGDTFMFLVSDGTAGFDTIRDYDDTEGDVINIADLLSGYDSGTDDIADFVTLRVVGSDTYIDVDMDGTGGTYAADAIVMIDNVNGFDLTTMINDGALVIA